MAGHRCYQPLCCPQALEGLLFQCLGHVLYLSSQPLLRTSLRVQRLPTPSKSPEAPLPFSPQISCRGSIFPALSASSCGCVHRNASHAVSRSAITRCRSLLELRNKRSRTQGRASQPTFPVSQFHSFEARSLKVAGPGSLAQQGGIRAKPLSLAPGCVSFTSSRPL